MFGMKSLIRLLRLMTRWERWLLLALCTIFVLSFLGLLRVFYVENTVLAPASGGTYIEGSVGELQPLNPWFIVQNDVNRDLVSLIFSGLLRYDPLSKKIVDDLATLETSSDSRVFTLHLKDNIFWQDSTPKKPHPVTADDVLFTFQTVQDPQFPNVILQQNFRGVKIEKLDDRTVRFTLDEPYSFFPSNLTLGLLPKSSFEGVPVSRLSLTTDFGYKPVGAGPYKLKNLTQTELSTEVTLERFQRTLPPPYRIDRIVFRIFSDYSSLLSDLRNLQGVRLVPRNEKGDPIIPRNFTAREYTLPQYVALFFNLDRKSLQDEKLRLGLQLGTDKKALCDSVYQPVLVDTPLLELDSTAWQYHFDPGAAQGALFASNWNLPEKMRLQQLLEQHDANKLGYLHAPPVASIGTGSVLTLTGSLKDVPLGSHVNGIAITQDATASGAWKVILPMDTGTGALHFGTNRLRLTDPKGKVIDSAYVFRAQTLIDYNRAMEEQRLLRLFLATRNELQSTIQDVTVANLFLENGKLRLRRSDDPLPIRTNAAGQQLVLHLLTSPSPVEYPKIAMYIQEAWSHLGVKVVVDIPKSRDEFQARLLKRDYDVLLFGQSLLDNLDSFPYWHSSGVQKVTGDANDLRQDAYNLSQYRSSRADALLETIRRTSDETERETALGALRSIIKGDVPAIFLYSPLYTFAHHNDILGIELGSLSLHSDRFLTLDRWYVQQNRQFVAGKSWWSFFPWLGGFLHGQNAH